MHNSGVKEYSGDLSYTTAYGYNALALLTSVTQGTQTRSFMYDSLGRLLTAENPETGRICYGTYDAQGSCVNGYDGNSNLLSRTDARGVVTTMEYDELNRLTGKTYNDATPPVTYEYDADKVIANVTTESKPKGRLVSVANSASTNLYRYDGLGRLLRASRARRESQT